MIVATVEQISPVFGAINLEDIAAPKCFDIEERLVERLDIPVMHDDQHGTAVVVLAGLRNAATLVGKRLDQMRVVVNGVGAAGTAIIHNLLIAGVGEITAVDRTGILNIDEDQHLTPMQQQIAARTNRERRRGGLAEALVGADAFIGVSTGNVLTAEMVQSMGATRLFLRLPTPSLKGTRRCCSTMPVSSPPDVPTSPTRSTMRSVFRAFSAERLMRAAKITPKMRLAAAEGLASVISREELNEEYIIPSVFNRDVVPAIAAAVARAARAEGVARADNGV